MGIVLVGGSGLIGAALSAALLRDGHEVTVLSRTPRRALLPAGAGVRQWDGRSSQGWIDLVEGAQAVVNLAGENLGAGRWTAERKRRIRESRLLAGQAVVEAVQKAAAPPRFVLQASAIGYYGSLADQPVSEDSPAGADFLSKVCLEWEESTAAVEALGVRRVVARSGLVLARSGGVLERLALPFRLFAGGPLGGGRQWYSWIHIADQVQAMLFLMQKEDCRGVFNLTAPEPATMEEFGRTLAQVMGRPYWAPVPAFALRLVLGEMSTLVLDGQRVFSDRLQAMGFQFRYPRLRPALEDLLLRRM